MSANVPAAVLDWVARYHQVVSELSDKVAAHHAGKLACGPGCAECCVDDLTVFAIEAARIERDFAELLAEGEPHPPGGCAMLDADGRCRVYASRPYVCRTQGLPLRWVEEEVDGSVTERRDVCHKNLVDEDIAKLPVDATFSLGPFEERLADRQASVDGGKLERVALRGLFATKSAVRRLPVVR